MATIDDELKRLNADTFAAENKEDSDTESWASLFERVLSPDFRIRRANGYVLQNKWEMIEQVRADDRKRDGPTDVLIWVEGDYGVVTSVVTLRGDPSGDTFQNLKLFQRRDSSDWQCVYWRVAKLTRK
jgi:hypothetical protein